jgi:hypothetical protein
MSIYWIIIGGLIVLFTFMLLRTTIAVINNDDNTPILQKIADNAPSIKIVLQSIGIILFFAFIIYTEQKSKSVGGRESTIQQQFSGWDGSHPALTEKIKARMNDPESYEHIDTKFKDSGTYIHVITEFRGKNAFGGKITNTVNAKVDFDGNVIEIISWN